MQTEDTKSFSPCDFYKGKDYFCTRWKTDTGVFPVYSASCRKASRFFYKLLYKHQNAQLWHFPCDGRSPILLGGEAW